MGCREVQYCGGVGRAASLPHERDMRRIGQTIGTVFAFLAGETLVCLMVLAAMICRVTAGSKDRNQR